VAAVVVGDAVRKAGADVLDAEPADEELAELVGPRRQIVGRLLLRRAGEELRIEDAEHRHARPARPDDRLGTGEDVDRVAGDLPGLVPEAGVEARLAAAGLGGAKLTGVPEPFEHRGHGEADPGHELVHEAGDEQADLHR
jgi:hypothetical protein